MNKILIVNGPNLNFLGIREKTIYGEENYNHLVEMLTKKGNELGVETEVYQSNHEGSIIDKLQESYYDKSIIGVVINPGAFTHYSYAIYDALKSVFVTKVEIHISDIMGREDFRRTSVTAPACDRQIYGHGLNGYLEAMDFVMEVYKKRGQV